MSRQLLDKLESALIAAWVYDTDLAHQEDYISGAQMKKADALMDKVYALKQELLGILENSS